MSRKSDEKQSRAPEANLDLDEDVEAAWRFVGVWPVLAGDFYAILSAADTIRNFPAKLCKVLQKLVTQTDYTFFLILSYLHHTSFINCPQGSDKNIHT